MYKFFVNNEQIKDNKVTITGDDAHHIKDVLRMREGETLLVGDGGNHEYVCGIESLDDDVVVNIVDMNREGRELPINVTLFQALPKADKMETIIQKMVELGVNEIVPVETSRCVVKLDSKKAEKKVKRWNAIAESAAKQSKRGIVPQIRSVVKFDDALAQAKHMDVIYMPYELADDMDYTRKLFEQIEQGMNIAIFIGPEGGFSEEEVKKATDIGAKSITLGKRILRTETAGMTVMAVLMYLNEV